MERTTLESLSTDELTRLQDAIAEILVARQAGAPEIALRIPTPTYNSGRFGKPWAALVTAWAGKPELDWAELIGGQDGYEGELRLSAKAGSVIRWGQRDNRGGRTSAKWGVVAEDGRVHRVDELAARRAFDGEKVDLGEPVALDSLGF